VSRLRVEAAVVGAGFAGLATAAALRAADVDFVLLESGADVGGAWARHYDRIRLHTPWHDLPHDGGLRHRFGMLLGRGDLLAYFQAYAKHHELLPRARFGERVVRIRRAGGTWELATESRLVSADFVAVATGVQRRPRIPVLPGAAEFGGRLLHSSAYRNAGPFRGARTLVVGSGNSACEIALDLLAGGAQPALWVRGPRHFVPLRALARAGRLAAWLPDRLVEVWKERAHGVRRGSPEFTRLLARRDRALGRLSVDLSRFGIQRPAAGPMSEMYLHGRVPVFDQGTIAAIRSGRLAVVDGRQRPITALVPGGVKFGDAREPFDVVVLATGFEPGLDELFEDHERLVAWDPGFAHPLPITDGASRSTVEPTLFFPGFETSALGGLGLGRWGWATGEAIARTILYG
jgi:cation diffusion facilitator CzcD-associated flavoprotein CzcO